MQISDRVKKWSVLIFLLAAFLCIALTGCEKNDKQQIKTLDDLAGKKIAVMTGSIYETKALECLPDSILEYYRTTTDCFLAVNEGKADALVVSSLFYASAADEYPSLVKLESLCDADLYYATTKSDFGLQVQKDLTEYLNKEWENGGQQELLDSWKNGSREATPIDFSSLTGDKGTIRCAVEPLDLPSACQVDGGFAGIEAENLYNFCKEYGYTMELQTMDWAAILAGVVTGKLDLCMYTYYSDERAEKILFAAPYEKSQVIVVTKDQSIATEGENQPEPSSADIHESKDNTASTESTVDPEQAIPANQSDTLADQYAEKKIGVITGTIFDQVAAQHLPESTVVYINSTADVALALESGEIEGYIADEPTARMIQKSYEAQYIAEVLEDITYGFIFQKNSAKSELLRSQFDAFFTELKADGTLTELYNHWLDDDESTKYVDFNGMTGENGELFMATSSDIGAPFSYTKYDQLCGYDIDLAVRFCKAYGYSLKISDFGFSSMMAGVASGNYDFGAASIGITAERAKTLDFSIPYYEGGIILAAINRAETDTTVLTDIGEYDKLNGRKIGVMAGTFFEMFSKELIPNCQLELFDSSVDQALALEHGKIDAYMTDQPIARMLLKQYPDHHVFAVASQENYGYVFPKSSLKSDYLRAEMNGYLKKLREDKTLQEIDAVWFGDDESKKVVDFSGLTGVNGELTMAVDSGVGEPFCYLKDGQYAGYDMDIAVRFCREYGYSLKIVDGDFGSMLAAVSSGECDFGASCITITEERKESMNFSDPNYNGGIVIVIRDMKIMEGTNRTERLEAMTGKRIGVLTGGWCDVAAEQSIPDCEVVYFNTNTDMAVALEKGKIDAYMTDEPVADKLISSYPKQQIYMNVLDDHYGVVFRKDTPESDTLRAQMNEFIAAYKSDGTIETMEAIWLGTDTDAQSVNFSGLTGENGTLNLALCSGVGEPFVYLKDGVYAGYDVDLITRFCRAYGYALNIQDSDFSGVLAAVATGQCDFGVSSISITEERKLSMNFADSYFENHAVLVVRSDAIGGGTAISSGLKMWQSIQDSFRKTFLRENRWELFVVGIGVTLLITLISAACGTAIGFLVFLLYRKKYRLPNTIINFLSDILRKMPVVVILMILYYLIFAKSNLSGRVVSCVGFTMIFACSVLGCLRVAVGAVDSGQMEAALALGYTDTRAFLRMILPQAMQHFLPAYQEEIVTLIKGTAIVGYIAVQDLTKVSDIVRSRTYEAFFPLIASALIYFAIAWLLTLMVQRVRLRSDPKHRSSKQILKEVRTK